MFGRQARQRHAVESGIEADYSRLWRYALSLAGARDRADDLAQAACVRAMEKHMQFEPGTNVTRWLFRILHNLWISELRREKVHRGNGLVAVELAEIVDSGKSPDDIVEHRELLDAVLQLPEAQRQTVVLVYVEGYSYKDAAYILSIPKGTVMSRLAAARHTLSQRLNAQREAKNVC